MGPFRRGKRELSAPPPSIDLKVEETAYRRLGDAFAIVVVTLGDPPPDDTHLVIRTDSAAAAFDPMMITREMPGSKSEAHRLWFAVDLTAVMFGDGNFALKTEDGEIPLPHPVAQPAWGAVEEEDPDVPASAYAEANLRAAVAALEARIRDAEQANNDLRADSRRMGETVAATLAEVQRERDRLIELLEQSTGDDAWPGTDQPPAEPEVAGPRPDAFLKRLQAARGAADADA